jgi:plastocyanin
MLRGLAALALAALFAGTASAGELSVIVRDARGAPLPDAVVTIPAPAGSSRPAFPWKLEIAQQNRQFAPFVLIAPQGAEVAFPNLDRFRHHVYSFSAGNRFELELYGREERRTVTFRTLGAAAIGCNIHDQMVAFVRVVDTPFAAKTDAAGGAVIANAPNGPVRVTVWHPYARARDQIVTSQAVIAADGSTRLEITLDVAPPAAHH